MNSIRAAATFLAIAALVACGGGPDNVLTEGTVIDRIHDDEDTQMVTICTGYGKYGCSGWTFIPQTDPESWSLVIEGEHGGKTVTERHEVDRAVYERTIVGEIVEVDR